MGLDKYALPRWSVGASFNMSAFPRGAWEREKCLCTNSHNHALTLIFWGGFLDGFVEVA